MDGRGGHLLARPPTGGIAVLGMTLLATTVRPLLSLRRRGNVRLGLGTGGLGHGLRQMVRDLGFDFFSALIFSHFFLSAV